ncbi:WD40/YVTN/BNR-like repeat-containing protein [Zobellia uliginosa]|uniref:WD40/YVTN/BNR-like repeat-containing protein n=1 Tax=Zobellia uliginosa TaxID=143224 RepID=UPI001C0649E7|nr:oxidoreductase [Zobellia uliginosa]MBU2945997.1 oxidoreductase [Zobellia uliginosa]
MRVLLTFLIVVLFVSCSEKHNNEAFSSVEIKTIYEDSVSIRAIEIMGDNLGYAGSNGVFGSVELATGEIMESIEKYHTIIPEFRAIAHTTKDFFMLSVANPALLYKTGDNGRMELVYMEEDENVFYDAMIFWNDNEGIAVGDSMNGCLSIIITRDGGVSWKKISCSELPEALEGEGAFAASNTNIANINGKTWIATNKSRVYFTGDKGKTWEIQNTPVSSNVETQGIFSIDFYDENIGFAIGGDFTKPEVNTANKAVTVDGGNTWQLIADGQNPQYKSCVQFVPGSNGNGLVAVGFTGVSYSNDRGETWKQLSEESFYTIRFQNEKIAYASGKNRIARLIFN